MKKYFYFFFILIFLSSCSEKSKQERYFKNCVKDGLSLKGTEEMQIFEQCEYFKRVYPDRFNYFKGKIFSKEK